MNTISVLKNSHTFFVAQEITGFIRQNKRTQIEAIGAEAVNRVVKALSMATWHLRAEDMVMTCVPEYSKVIIEDRCITAIKIVVDPNSANAC